LDVGDEICMREILEFLWITIIYYKLIYNERKIRYNYSIFMLRKLNINKLIFYLNCLKINVYGIVPSPDLTLLINPKMEELNFNSINEETINHELFFLM